jgi:hypothetical protein
MLLCSCFCKAKCCRTGAHGSRRCLWLPPPGSTSPGPLAWQFSKGAAWSAWVPPAAASWSGLVFTAFRHLIKGSMPNQRAACRHCQNRWMQLPLQQDQPVDGGGLAGKHSKGHRSGEVSAGHHCLAAHLPKPSLPSRPPQPPEPSKQLCPVPSNAVCGTPLMCGMACSPNGPVWGRPTFTSLPATYRHQAGNASCCR